MEKSTCPQLADKIGSFKTNLSMYKTSDGWCLLDVGQHYWDCLHPDCQNMKQNLMKVMEKDNVHQNHR